MVDIRRPSRTIFFWSSESLFLTSDGLLQAQPIVTLPPQPLWPVRGTGVVARDEALFELIVQAHRWIGYTLGLLVITHVGAALEPHFVNRDGVLTRMLRGAPPPVS